MTITALEADASPEKRLFISLITRDISLVAAFLDLIDNSINAAVEPASHRLLTAEDYLKLSQDETVTPKVDIFLTVSPEEVEIRDTALGISAKTAAEQVFKFGKASDEAHVGDRLSVYGIGLKRAIFKLGNKIIIQSDHADGGFDLKLNVSDWAKDTKQPWTFPITSREPAKNKTGTKVLVTELHEDSKRRFSDGVFLGQLKEAIGRTYAFYLSKFVNIYVNEEKISGVNIEIGSNHSFEQFKVGDVSCAITAGIGIPQGGSFRDRSSGWFIFCNGRTVISADKSLLTGWGGGGTGLPIFQPKHRPFLGFVFFVSTDAEKLPWTTTKSGINEDSAIWQEAKRYMITVGRGVISFLDGRYTDEGTEIASADLQEAAKDRINLMSAVVSQKRVFEPPKRPPPQNLRIQFDAKVDDVKRIEEYLGRRGMSGAEVGRYTFNYFLRNEVGES
ncbi:Histidine kinase-, DNA gyrase B-, and HSP90-like ATPase [Nitrosospira multiformis]|uniref:Histidine kinase-, DNA gyrase B-, and HSP90-like ATPase n=1 Tax=Nitrosospira multiformis TaxID=1231 RepID=A0A1H8KUV9_9PROT|nr:ATP-binding protein [Nitrosospira multiformis]SEN96665.1 Histidine kinase-, DNA gyrase B-, and HSP90-like ATPase [Nitrosospira multiformis]